MPRVKHPTFPGSRNPRQATPPKKIKSSSTREEIRYSTLGGYETWKTGVWNCLPWLGVLSLLGVLMCLGFNVIILVLSDGMPTTKWDVQPSVLLAISAVISNGLLRFALTEGAAISWWVKATQGCTVNDLHRYWTFANNVFDCIKRIKYFNLLLLASIASVVISIDNPLFQRASRVVCLRRVIDTTCRPVNTSRAAADSYRANDIGTDYAGAKSVSRESFSTNFTFGSVKVQLHPTETRSRKRGQDQISLVILQLIRMRPHA